jgi:oxygen-dependent protoporphyrinogen oxidase
METLGSVDGTGHVVVVGCGIAGAAAAHRLQRRGFEVTVLESEPTVGGRTSTETRDGFTIDLAATMLLSSYHRAVELIAEEGWQDQFEPGSDLVGVERDGRVHHIRASKPQGAVSTGLLSWRAKLALGTVVKDVLRHRKVLDWENPARAWEVDYGTVREYADTRVRNPELRDHLLDPACRFLGLSDLADISAVDFLFLAKNMGKTALFNSPGGIDTLVQLLMSDVKVETGAVVSSVEERPDRVTVTWSAGDGSSRRADADACILAVPAPAAVRIHPQMGDERAHRSSTRSNTPRR